MGDEEGEVEWAHPALAREGDRADLIVVYQIANEKKAGDAEGCHHADLVARHFFLSDEEIPHRKEYSACPVEQGVDGG